MTGRACESERRYALGFVMEQTLGHVTHHQNFRECVAQDPTVTPTWMPIAFEQADGWGRLPGVRSNWTVRASLRARSQLRHALRTRRLDGLFFHTPVTALFAQRLMQRIPTVVSMDATPLNFDSVGNSYDHAPSGAHGVEAIKNALNRRTFSSASALITWSEWAKRSLVADYGVSSDKVCVIPPGVDLLRWRPSRDIRPDTPVRALFVGGDFRRKGGELLLQAFGKALADECELDIVTRDVLEGSAVRGVRVHTGLRANSPELMSLFARADLFVFPTFGDCLPIAVMEAMAAGLPVVATDVGAIAEEVDHGVTGFLIDSGDIADLTDAVRSLVRDPARRRRMGIAGRAAAERKFDGARNYARVLAVCKAAVAPGGSQ